mmetsp:Transcript_35584/g.75997  ORF Transcript_35584/g.75997 Transcript_35584/m.75997 type:complete len:325 (+) Transcript_35584:285-1259(+)
MEFLPPWGAHVPGRRRIHLSPTTEQIETEREKIEAEEPALSRTEKGRADVPLEQLRGVSRGGELRHELREDGDGRPASGGLFPQGRRRRDSDSRVQHQPGLQPGEGPRRPLGFGERRRRRERRASSGDEIARRLPPRGRAVRRRPGGVRGLDGRAGAEGRPLLVQFRPVHRERRHALDENRPPGSPEQGPHRGGVRVREHERLDRGREPGSRGGRVRRHTGRGPKRIDDLLGVCRDDEEGQGIEAQGDRDASGGWSFRRLTLRKISPHFRKEASPKHWLLYANVYFLLYEVRTLPVVKLSAYKSLSANHISPRRLYTRCKAQMQ